MNNEQIIQKFHDQLTRHGAHLMQILQTVSDATRQPLNTLQVLDLACLEELYGIEFARHGAWVIAIQGREANIEKARFAKDVLEWDNITLVQDDVRKSQQGHQAKCLSKNYKNRCKGKHKWNVGKDLGKNIMEIY